MYFKNWIILLIIIILSFTKIYASDQPWKKELDKNGVQVYLRECSGCELKEFKAQTKIAAPIEKVMALLLDFKSYPKWVFNNRGTFQLQTKGKDEFIYYTQIECPKPTEDRDLIVDFKIVEQTSTKCIIKTSNLPNFVNEKPNFVRVKVFNGSWELVKISDNETLVTTQCYSTPGGTVPAWIINTFITTGPYNTMNKMRELLTPKASKK